MAGQAGEAVGRARGTYKRTRNITNQLQLGKAAKEKGNMASKNQRAW